MKYDPADLDKPKKNYVVTASIEFIIEAPSIEYARDCAKGIVSSLDDYSIRASYGGYANAVRSKLPKVSAVKRTDNKLPNQPATRRF